MVVSDFASGLRNIWPFSILEGSDLRESNKLVHRLSVPESTKNFVFAVRVPEHDSTIYILSAQNLSQRSASDAECLIREIRPGAVVAQVDRSAFGEAQVEESVLGDGSSDSIPTSAFRVLTQCFVDKVNKEKYESVAGILVLREIFGTSFNGHLLAAKRVAREVGSSFMVLESPFVNIAATEASSGEIEGGGKMHGLANSLSLIPQNAGSAIVSSSRRFLITNDAQAQMLKLLSSHINQLGKELRPSSCVASGVSNETQFDSHEVPPFAQSIYSLLVDLHDIFIDLPSIRKSLTNARKMLSDVNRGESMDTGVISEVYLFQIAVEGLRIALNNAGRLASSRRAKVQFSQLSSEDKSYALMADLLRSQAQKFKNIVAVVDASNLAGLRKHWNTCVPQEVKDMSEHMVQDFDSDESSNDSKLKRLLSDKPVVAVGAGATAIWGASSLSKAISASPFFKLLTFKAPASLNLFLTHTHKVMTFAFTKVAYPSKVMAPGLASSGAKSTSLVKASLSAEKIRAVTQGIIASAEKTSLSAMRAAFYEIMRKRRAKPIGTLPLATFGVSLATCAGLLVYEEEIECAAVSLPSAPSIAKLGRGIQNLHEASLEVRRTESNRIHNAIETLRQRLKKFTLQ